MLQKRSTTCCWGLGLSKEQAEELGSFLGQEYSLELRAADCLPTEADLERFPPYLIWLSSEAQNHLAKSDSLNGPLAHIPKALILDEEYSLKNLEEAADMGMTEVLRPPMTRVRVRGIMRRAMEVQNMQSDILSMTRNILLERELLERKNELLNFLVNFLTSISGTLDIRQILQATYASLGKLFPVRALCAAFWDASGPEKTVDLHLFAKERAGNRSAWKKMLLGQAEALFGAKLKVKNCLDLDLPEISAAWQAVMPTEGHVLTLPVKVGNQTLGLLLLLTDMESSLGRDQATALDSALQHLGLCIRNTQHLSRIQMFADYDGLTRLHSRRHFDERLNQEMEKFTRYGQTFSLILLDIDHFKVINDTYGHPAGDEVLKIVAKIIKKSIRNSDYCARIGGEEFVAILPHTDAMKAAALAERLRRNVANHTFILDNGPLYITASLGVVQARLEGAATPQEILREADANLYSAKRNGRNRTCDSFSLLQAAQ